MSRRRVLLIGAGFSANWGGLLSKDIASLLYSYARDIRFAGKEYFLTDANYEQAWEHVLDENPKQREQLKAQFEDNLVRAFEFHQQCLALHPSLPNSSDVVTLLKDLLTYQAEQSLLVTTNQDLLLERLSAPAFELVTPGMVSSQPTSDGNNNRYLPRRMPSAFNPPTPQRSLIPLIKLHGSYDWRWNGRPVLITGVSKRPEDWPEYLQGSLDWLKGWLREGPVDLVIIGHAMADGYLVELLSEACGPEWRVFIVDSAAAHDWFREKNAFCQSRLMKQLQCYLPRRFGELVRPNRVESAYRAYVSEIRDPIVGLRYGEV